MKSIAGGLKTALTWERLGALALLIALAAFRIVDPAPIEVLRLKTFDLMQQMKPRATPAELPVMIVDIDEDSLKKHGQWPWPRTLLAELLDKLSAKGVKVVGFDVLFSEPDRLSGTALAKALPQADEETRERLKKLPSGETVLAEAMTRVPVVIGAAGYEKPLVSDTPPRPAQVAVIGMRPEQSLYSYQGLLRPRPELEAKARGIGLISVLPERDGTVRRVPTALVAQGALLPTLDLELLRLASGGDAIKVRSNEAGVSSVMVGGRVLSTDTTGQLWVNFGSHDRARYASAADVLDERVPSETLKDKMILIGSSAVALFDLRTTPLDRLIPGVEIHAQVIENILAGTLLQRPNYALGYELAVMLLIGIVIIVLVPRLGAGPMLLVGGAAMALLVAATWMLYSNHRLLFDLSFPMLSTSLVFVTLAFANYWSEEARRTQIRGAFSQYVSPALVEKLVNDPDRLKLGGETREMSILFSDVRGFTGISERYKGDPEGLVSLMNGLLTPLTHAILDTQGTIDKYMGDAILAFWNAPLDDDDHAVHACLAALDMRQRLSAFNAERRKLAEAAGEAYTPIEIGVGINTGSCVVGNFGSDIRFDYSVVGDSVNIASRLEALTGAYGTGILIGARTAEAAAHAVSALPVDRILVKGKKEPETIYTVLGKKDVEESPWFAPLRASLRDMHVAYTAADWTGARKHLEAARRIDTESRLKGIFALFDRRLEALSSKAEPPPGWNGVYAMSSKDGS